MDFINNMTSSPLMTGILAASLALLYFFLMTFSPNLPPALLFSAVIGYFVYSIRSQSPSQPQQQQQSQQQQPKLNIPQPYSSDLETNDDHIQRMQLKGN